MNLKAKLKKTDFHKSFISSPQRIGGGIMGRSSYPFPPKSPFDTALAMV